MSRNGTGTYSLAAGNPVVAGTTITDTWANNTLGDIATAMTASIANDGQTPILANLPMGGFKFTGLGAGTVAGDSVTYEQLPRFQASGAATGSGDTWTIPQAAAAGASVPLYLNGVFVLSGVADPSSGQTLTLSSTTITASPALSASDRIYFGEYRI